MAMVTWAAALTVVAPDADKPAALRMTLARPFASVRAVPVAGENTPSVELVANVTTTPARGVPDAERTRALTLAGLLNEMAVRGALVASSVRVSVILGSPLAETAESPETAPLPQALSHAANTMVSDQPRPRLAIIPTF